MADTNTQPSQADQAQDHTPSINRSVRGQYDGAVAWEGPPPAKITQAEWDKLDLQSKSAYQLDHERFRLATESGNVRNGEPGGTTNPDAPKIKVGDTERSLEEVQLALSEKAARDSERLSLPAEAKDYRLELPKDLVLPEGVKVEFDEKNPIKATAITAAREFAKRHNLSQTAFSEMLGVYAASMAGEQADFQRAHLAEVAKLGPAGGARVDAVSRWLRAEVGEDLAGPMLTTLVTEKHVRAFETLIQKRVSGGVGAFSQSGRDHSAPGLTEAQWNSMTFTEKREYTERASSRR